MASSPDNARDAYPMSGPGPQRAGSIDNDAPGATPGWLSRTLHVAIREYASTVLTKGFLIGAVIVPIAIALIMGVLGPRLMDQRSPETIGTWLVADHSGQLEAALRSRLTKESLDIRANPAIALAKAASQKMGSDSPEAKAAEAIAGSTMEELGFRGQITLEMLPHDTPPDELSKRVLANESPRSGGPIAVSSIAPDAVVRQPDSATFGGYSLMVHRKLDQRIISILRDIMTESIREVRYQANNADASELRALTTVQAPPTVEVTEKGTRSATGALRMFMPFIMMIVMMMGVMTGGQYLLTTTVEEKSSRVVEVLLSAVSAMQLMAGKILGQMAVGMSMMLLYVGAGIGVLAAFSLTGLVAIGDVALLGVFFVFAYVMMASMMAAIGAAVSDLREAQSLMAPAMIVMMVPYFLGVPISQNPNSVWATVLSFVPPLGPFVAVLRQFSSDPPPAWQTVLALVAGLAGAIVMVWAAAKIFRVGLLLHGKPPTFGTLWRWIRMA